MNFVLSASRLMKASEIRALCKELREQKHILVQQEVQAKAFIFNKLNSQKGEAASIKTLTA